jgi:hypothetical protein
MRIRPDAERESSAASGYGEPIDVTVSVPFISRQ